MTSKQPYLLKAMYNWILDNHLTPYILVSVKNEKVIVPMEYVNDGKIVLNLHPESVDNFNIENEILTFNASFNSIMHMIQIPCRYIHAIYTQENNQGMFFEDFLEDEKHSSEEKGSKKESGSVSHLKLIK